MEPQAASEVDIVDILAEIHNIIRTGGGVKHLAAYGVKVTDQLTGAEDQSAVARHILRACLEKADLKQSEFVNRALEVMDKFPCYPRPRAAAARAALKHLAQ